METPVITKAMVILKAAKLIGTLLGIKQQIDLTATGSNNHKLTNDVQTLLAAARYVSHKAHEIDKYEVLYGELYSISRHTYKLAQKVGKLR